MAYVTTEELRDAIANVLKGADLNALSAKKVRKKLEEHFEEDFTHRKQEIDDLVMEAITANQKASQSEDEGSEDEDSDSASSLEDSPVKKTSSPPPSKKQKTENLDVESKSKKKTENSSAESESEVDDEALARKLQEEERLPRRRAATKKVTPRKRAPKKKDADKPKNKKGLIPPTIMEKSYFYSMDVQFTRTHTCVAAGNSVYSKKCILSESLAEVVGAKEMARHGVVKRIWEVARERNLFDPKNKRYVICDEQLQKIFENKKRVLLFGMMKYLKNHIIDSDRL